MLIKRTDLALEAHEINAEQGKDDGVITREETRGNLKITFAEIKEGKGEELTKKRAGMYITADIGKVWQDGRADFNEKAKELSKLLASLLPETDDKTVLAIGLGNEDITADALGPQTVSRLLVTRHIKILNPELAEALGFGNLSAFCPGVLGQTGIESASLIKSAVDSISPACVIVVDALAARRLERLATTVQLSNTGISPGSGVENKRTEISKETLGVPVVSVGIPTVVDAATLACDLFEKCGATLCENEAVIEEELKKQGGSLFITPKESDSVIKETSKLLARAINLALHKDLSPEELSEYSPSF